MFFGFDAVGFGNSVVVISDHIRMFDSALQRDVIVELQLVRQLARSRTISLNKREKSLKKR